MCIIMCWPFELIDTETGFQQLHAASLVLKPKDDPPAAPGSQSFLVYHTQKCVSCKHPIWPYHFLIPILSWEASLGRIVVIFPLSSLQRSSIRIRRLFSSRHLCGSASRIKDTDWRRSWDGTVTHPGFSLSVSREAASTHEDAPSPIHTPSRKQPYTSINRGDSLPLNHIFSAWKTLMLIFCK